jgi:cobalt-zinc-cadmium efflux system membrane fusion protein
VICSVLFVAGLLATTGCSKKEEPQAVQAAASAPSNPGEVTLPPDSPKLQQIKVEEVQAVDVPTDEVIAPGKIEVNPNRIAHITLPVAGRIMNQTVKLGDTVQKGQLLFTVESPDADAASAAHLQALASINLAKAALLKGQKDLDRIKDLYEHKAIAQKEVVNAESTVSQAQALLDQSEALAKQAARKLEILGLKTGEFGQKVAVRSPMTGKVLEFLPTEGEYRNDTNLSVMTIADLSTVWVASDVPESQIRLIQIGEPLEIQLTAFPNETFHGRVTRLADTVDPQTRTVKVRAEMDNSRGRLRPEMFGSIRHVEGLVRRPVVPPGAIIQGDGQNIVYVETAPGVFHQTQVEVGNRFKDLIPILKGLKSGDRIVTDGAMLLKKI